MTDRYATASPSAISPRTGKLKKKPRGRPFRPGGDPRRSIVGGDTTPAPEPEAPLVAPIHPGHEDEVFRAILATDLASDLANAAASGDADALQRVQRQARDMAAIRHAGLMRDYDAQLAAYQAECSRRDKLAAEQAAAKLAAGVVDLSGVDPKEFPLEDVLKLADGIESARKTGRIGVGFSARRQAMAGKLWTVFRGCGLSSPEAFRLTFGVLASERASDDERPFYEELWRSKFATDLYPLPVLPVPPTSGDELWHPQAGTVLALIRAGIPVWLAGDAGAGKTYLTAQLADLLDRPYHRVQGSRDRTLEEIVGAWGYSPDDGTVFRYGAVPLAMQAGAVLHIDEISAMPSEVTFELHAVLEGQPLTLTRKGNEHVTPEPGFVFVANDNTIGDGERSDMIGTQPVNAAFRDRWAFIRIEGMSKSLRKRMILQAIETQIATGV